MAERLRHAFENRQDALLTSLDERGLSDEGYGALRQVLVELHASGMCHSDEHLLTGDMPFHLPCIGGHEGAGVVQAVGEKVTSVAPGDHVVFGFMPSCGRCPSCSSGHQSLCDLGARLALNRHRETERVAMARIGIQP